MPEKHFRSVIKSITWRALATLTTITLVYLFTGDLTISLEIGAIEVVAKLLIYYFHERAWGWIGWGKENKV
jgi:uncharacterized membrane protein